MWIVKVIKIIFSNFLNYGFVLVKLKCFFDILVNSVISRY